MPCSSSTLQRAGWWVFKSMFVLNSTWLMSVLLKLSLKCAFNLSDLWVFFKNVSLFLFCSRLKEKYSLILQQPPALLLCGTKKLLFYYCCSTKMWSWKAITCRHSGRDLWKRKLLRTAPAYFSVWLTSKHSYIHTYFITCLQGKWYERLTVRLRLI